MASIPGADESAISSSTAQEQSRVAAQVLSEEEAEYELGGDGLRLSGLRGLGPPLRSVLNGKTKPFTDGCGLRSPGRWPPNLRQCASESPSLALHERIGQSLQALLASYTDTRSLAFKLATGRVTESPFSEQILEQARDIIFRELKAAGSILPVEVRTAGQPFFLAAIAELLRLAGDPDHDVFFAGKDSVANGVRLGVDVPLPRVPAVYTAKKSWRVYEDEEGSPAMRDNYMSAKHNSAVVQAQFEKEAELGAMVELTVAEAESQWGAISVASLGALEKKDGSLRVIHDATHGLAINSKIRVQDQIRSPMAGDLKRCPGPLGGLLPAHWRRGPCA